MPVSLLTWRLCRDGLLSQLRYILRLFVACYPLPLLPAVGSQLMRTK